MDNTKIADMDKSIRCLALELPEPVWEDVNKRWQSLKAALPATPTTGGIDKDYNFLSALFYKSYEAFNCLYGESPHFPTNRKKATDFYTKGFLDGGKWVKESPTPKASSWDADKLRKIRDNAAFREYGDDCENEEAFRQGFDAAVKTISESQSPLPAASKPEQERLSYVETMKQLRESPLGEAWDKIICVCRQLIKDNPCDANCKEFHDESLPNERQ